MTAEQMLFTEKDLEKSMDKIETVHFHEVTFITQGRGTIQNYTVHAMKTTSQPLRHHISPSVWFSFLSIHFTKCICKFSFPRLHLTKFFV